MSKRFERDAYDWTGLEWNGMGWQVMVVGT